jgi:hypothetical protein
MSFKPPPQRQARPPIPCAWGECENMVTRGAEYSFIITFATRGPDGRAGAFQCPDADEIAAGNYDAQHFCCSAECAAKCAHACIDEHLVPRHQDHIASLAAHDAALAAEQAAMEAYRAELGIPAAPAPGTQVPADGAPAQEAPPRWIDPAALALVQAANAATQQESAPASDVAPQPDEGSAAVTQSDPAHLPTMDNEPAPAEAPAPSDPPGEDVTQVVQQVEEPDAAPEPPPHAEPAQEAATPDSGPPTLLAIPVIPATPDEASDDASHPETVITHDDASQPAERDTSDGQPASNEELSEAAQGDADGAGTPDDAATVDLLATAPPADTGGPGQPGSDALTDGVRRGLADQSVDDQPGDRATGATAGASPGASELAAAPEPPAPPEAA